MNSYPVDDLAKRRGTARHTSSARTPESIDAAFVVPFVHRLRFTHDAFRPGSSILTDLIRKGAQNLPAKVLVFVDDGVQGHWPDLDERLQAYFNANEPTLQLAGPIVQEIFEQSLPYLGVPTSPGKEAKPDE